MRLSKLFTKLRHKIMPRAQAVHETCGYNIVIENTYFLRWERYWKDAYKITSRLRRQGVRAHFHRVVPKEKAA